MNDATRAILLPVRAPIPGAVLSLVGVAFSELQRDLAALLASHWEEVLRRRADELASTLARACDQQGLREVAVVARALANLTRLSQATALPLRPALKGKFRVLLLKSDRLLAAHAGRYVG
jgi:hypothetical protein